MEIKLKHFKYVFHPLAAFDILFKRWRGLPFKIWIVNAVFQRIFRINSEAEFQIHYTSTVIKPERIQLGRNVWRSLALSGGCYIQGGNGIYIGDDTLFAPGVKIISANHDPTSKMEWATAAPIRIGRRCWIGANAVILPGVALGDDCVVGAGAVVTKSFDGGCTVVGIPARLAVQFSDNRAMRERGGNE